MLIFQTLHVSCLFESTSYDNLHLSYYLMKHLLLAKHYFKSLTHRKESECTYF